jgi:hypothetical protein
MSVTITNTGNVALAGGTFTFGGGTPVQFANPNTPASTCGATLALGAQCTYYVVFTPTAATFTSISQTLTVAYTGAAVANSPVTLTGRGVNPGRLTFSSLPGSGGTVNTINTVRTLTFNPIPSARPNPVTATVTITATGGPVQITAESLTNNNSGLFSIASTTCSYTTPLAQNGTCTATFQYATPPSRPGTFNTATADIANDGTGTTGGNSVLNVRAQ